MNKSDENSPASKRLKVDDKDTNKYLRARITTLQEEKKKLQQQLEEMQATWMRKWIYSIDNIMQSGYINERNPCKLFLV